MWNTHLHYLMHINWLGSNVLLIISQRIYVHCPVMKDIKMLSAGVLKCLGNTPPLLYRCIFMRQSKWSSMRIICRHDDNLYLWCLCCCPLTFVPLNYTNKYWLPLHSHFLHGEMAINWVILWLAIKSKPMWGLSGRRCDFYKLKKTDSAAPVQQSYQHPLLGLVELKAK